MFSFQTSTSRRSKLPRIYRRLDRRFGPQGWWPTTPAGSEQPVYSRKNIQGPLSEKQRLEICLGVFLTQNTNWNNVVKVLTLLNRSKALNFNSLRRLGPAALERIFRSSGYFRQKTRRVRSFLAAIEKETGGRLDRYLSGPVPALREKLLRLPGVGPETADSMILYAAQKPIFVIDAYTRRIAMRWGTLKGNESYEEVQRIFTEALPVSAPLFNQYHALLVELAKIYCKKIPECLMCPVAMECRTGREGKEKK